MSRADRERHLPFCPDTSGAVGRCVGCDRLRRKGETSGVPKTPGELAGATPQRQLQGGLDNPLLSVVHVPNDLERSRAE